jgi:hypothetical protein
MFKARPSMIELVQPMSRQENVKYGEFRVISTNEHLGSSIRVVLLTVPQQQREWFEGQDFSKDSKQCFSLDGVRPHDRAAHPPVMFCANCPKGDINWVKWRNDKRPENLPPCSAYWHTLVADRSTQSPYFLNIKGKSFLPFKQAMEQQMAGLLNKIFADVRAKNKVRGYTWVADSFQFINTPGFVVPEGQTQEAMLPIPNIFDISFVIKASKNGAAYVMQFSDFALMKPEDKAEFGQLYLDINQQRIDMQQQREEEAEAVSAVTEAPAEQTKGEVLPPITI